MAKLKKELEKPVEAIENEKDIEATQGTEQVGGEDAPVAEGTDKEIETEQVGGEDAPEWAKRLMANFASLPEMYISKTGGVFTPDTPKSLVKGATLYKNPYYKN